MEANFLTKFLKFSTLNSSKSGLEVLIAADEYSCGSNVPSRNNL